MLSRVVRGAGTLSLLAGLALCGLARAEEGAAEPDQSEIVTAYRASQAALDTGNVEMAIEQGERAVTLATAALGASHKTTGILAYNLAAIYTGQERWAEAKSQYEAALVGYEATYGKDAPELINVLDGLGEAHGRLEAHAEARATLDRSLALTEAKFGKDSDEVGELLQSLGLLAQQQGESKEAMAFGKRALKIFKSTRGKEDVQVGLLYFGLGTLAAQTGDVETAQRNIDKGEAILAKALPAGHPYLVGLYDYLADTYKNVGMTSKARRFRRKAEEHRAAAEANES